MEFTLDAKLTIQARYKFWFMLRAGHSVSNATTKCAYLICNEICS